MYVTIIIHMYKVILNVTCAEHLCTNNLYMLILYEVQNLERFCHLLQFTFKILSAIIQI